MNEVLATNETVARESGELAPGMTVAEIIRQAVLEAVRAAREAELSQALEHRVRELETAKIQLEEATAKSAQYHAQFKEAEKRNAIVDILRRLGVSNIELAYRAVKENVRQAEDGQYVAEDGKIVPLSEYLEGFVTQNPELLPVRVGGGSGIGIAKGTAVEEGIELESIRPGMPREEWNKAREYISKLLLNSIRYI